MVAVHLTYQSLFPCESIVPQLHCLLVKTSHSKSTMQAVSIPWFGSRILYWYINPRLSTLMLGPHISVYFCKCVCTCAVHKSVCHLWFKNWASWNCLAWEYRACKWVSREGGPGFWQYQECLPSEWNDHNCPCDYDWVSSSSFQWAQLFVGKRFFEIGSDSEITPAENEEHLRSKLVCLKTAFWMLNKFKEHAKVNSVQIASSKDLLVSMLFFIYFITQTL